MCDCLPQTVTETVAAAIVAAAAVAAVTGSVAVTEPAAAPEKEIEAVEEGALLDRGWHRPR